MDFQDSFFICLCFKVLYCFSLGVHMMRTYCPLSILPHTRLHSHSGKTGISKTRELEESPDCLKISFHQAGSIHTILDSCLSVLHLKNFREGNHRMSLCGSNKEILFHFLVIFRHLLTQDWNCDFNLFKNSDSFQKEAITKQKHVFFHAWVV